MTTTFWLLAFGLCIIATAFILLPGFFLRRKQGVIDAEDRLGLNVSIYEERAAEYQRSLEQEEINRTEFDQLILELKKNLLRESEAQTEVTGSLIMGRLPAALAVLVPVFALLAYSDYGLSWGSIDDLDLAQELKSANPHDAEAMRGSILMLAESLKSQPDNNDGWFLLARSYLNAKMYEKAAETFQYLLGKFPDDYQLLSYYTEAVYWADERQMTDRVKQAIEKTLALNPHEINTLEIKGMALFQAGDLQASLEVFRKAIASGPEPARAEQINAAISRIEEELVSQGITPTVQPKRPVQIAAAQMPVENPGSTSEPASGRQLHVMVEVADSVDMASNTPVFVFARAVNGPPMPLAVKRMTREALPALIVLDESMAMMPGMGMANFDQVQVVARISSSGIANVSPDDYEALSSSIDLTKKNPVITLRIEKRVKDRI